VVVVGASVVGASVNVVRVSVVVGTSVVVVASVVVFGTSVVVANYNYRSSNYDY
jgi:hypothetical protein